jgi:glyoxylase-like metal-dependent hydrolase (beta-lactamase superfamily II)
VRASELRVVRIGPLGPFDNNAYLIIDPASRESIIVDAPPESERILEAARGARVSRIIITHRHGDHWAGVDVLRSATNAPVYCHAADSEPHADEVDGVLADGEEIALGEGRLRVVHTPGHTPGSICLLTGHILIAGDTLFPGGPGHGDTPDDLQQEFHSIVERLFVLPDDTAVYPGHGDGTTIGRSKREYAVFASREHPADLCGDVLWEA